MLWVHIRSASVRPFWWVPMTCSLRRKKKIRTFWLKKMSGAILCCLISVCSFCILIWGQIWEPTFRCVPSYGSDQPVHLLSLIFLHGTIQIAKYPISSDKQGRFRSECKDSISAIWLGQSDLTGICRIHINKHTWQWSGPSCSKHR